MPNYFLLLYSEPDAFNETSAAEMQAIIQKYTEWRLRLEEKGVLVGAEKLVDETGRTIRRHADKITVADGPYTESKEIIGGFFEIQVEDYSKAVDIARDCPHVQYGMIEIREVELIVPKEG